jgi:hypothetical protein
VKSVKHKLPVERAYGRVWRDILEVDFSLPIETPHQRDFTYTQRTRAVIPDDKIEHAFV